MTMMKTTQQRKSLPPEERKKRVAELREYHQPYFESVGESRAKFTAKMLYGYPPDKSKFFYSEIGMDTPLYVEFVTWDYKPSDERRLYMYKFNPDYEKDYVKEQTDSGIDMYVVPLEQFRLVTGPDDTPVPVDTKEEPKANPQASLDLDFDIINPDEDCPADNITLRDWAAILLKAPVSRKEWLNKLIKDTCQK